MGLFPIVIQGNKITVPGMPVRDGYFAFRTAILDGLVPLSMPIGFRINSPSNIQPLSAIDRNPCCLESMLSIATNVAGLIFVGEMGNIVSTEEQKGRLTSGNVTWRSRGVYECRPINPDQHLLTAERNVSIELRIHKAAGYQSIADNAAVLGDVQWFPLTTVHSLIDYVRVLPLSGDTIEVRYINGMTPELLKTIWEGAVGDANPS